MHTRKHDEIHTRKRDKIHTRYMMSHALASLCAHRECYAVATAQEVSVWCIRHEQEYKKLRGGHTRAVVALHACSGGTVRY